MPSLLSRLIGAVAPTRETKYSRAAKLLAMHALGQPYWSARNSTTLTREGYERNAVCHRCVRMVAEAAASVPWLVYEGREEAVDHPLLSLIERPNPLDTSASFIETICANLLLYGNAYVESVLIDEELRELCALRPDRMSIEAGRNGWPAAFIYRALGQEARYEMRGEGIEPILHIKFFNPLDDYYGFPPLAAAQVALDTHNAASFWNKALLDNSARPSGALVYAGPEGAHLTDEQFSRLKEELEENFSGATNAGRPLLLEGGLDWKALSLSPKDMDFTESKAGAAREIALAFGVPPLLLGLPGDNTFSNYTEANRAFWRQTVLPLVARVQKSFQAWLQPGFGHFRLDYNADRLEALASERAAEWERVGKAAFLTLDEQREALGYGPAPKEALFAKRDVGLERRYSPDQPRVPAGSSGGGQWTSDGGGGDSGGDSSGGRDDRTRRRDVEDRVRTALNANPNVASDADNPITRVQSRRVGGDAGATPAQFARETITAERAARAMTRVQELDPDWRPPQTLIDPENIEHRIERNESDFREADARYAELLRAKFGDNMPPRDSLRRLRTRESVIEEFYPSGVTGPEQDRIDSLARDPASPRQPRWPEVATILRLEKETGRPFKRSSASGADFQDEFGQKWDAVGSDASDQFFNYEEFTNRLNRKLSNRAVDRYVVDLSGLGGKNAARVLSYIWGLPVETQARIRVLR